MSGEVSWLREVFATARRMVQDGERVIVDHHEDEDGAVTKLMISDSEHRIRITWGRDGKKDWR